MTDIPDMVNTQALFDSIAIEPGAMRVGDGRSFPLLKFKFSTSGEEGNESVIHFVGTPLMLDDMRRLLRDAVQEAIRYSRQPPA
jgi:hypothetical protein